MTPSSAICDKKLLLAAQTQLDADQKNQKMADQEGSSQQTWSG